MLYRYAFGRWWGDTDLASTAIWVLLNPATGDTEKRRRPTLERCIARSRALGHSGLVIVNLFAFRDTNPRGLRNAQDAVGPANDHVLRVLTTRGAQTVAAWGGHGHMNGRSAEVGPLLQSPVCLGTTKRGEPRHPLYVAAEADLVPWVPTQPSLEPDDELLTAVLLQASAAERTRLRAALRVLKIQDPQSSAVVAWSPMTGTGSSTDPIQLSYPQYNAVVTELVAALQAARAQPNIDWMRWDGAQRYPRGAGLATAPVADSMRLITTIVRSEKFSDGSIARAVEDGSLVAAAERICAALEV